MSRQLENQVSAFFFRLSKNESIVMWVMALLFWPGVLLHELSHLIVGRVLLVKTGKMTLIPKMQTNGMIAMGSVHVPQTDRLRFFLIGIAPVYVGISVIFGTLWAADHLQLWGDWMWMGIIGYIMFQVTNNMFLSSSDLNGAIWLLI